MTLPTDIPGWLVAFAFVVAAYVILVTFLYVAGKRLLAREVALLVPNLIRLFRGLLGDARVPLAAKAFIGLGLLWLASPIDLIPEFVPLVGPLDDVIVAALVLALVSRMAGRGVIRDHWRGDATVLARVLRLA